MKIFEKRCMRCRERGLTSVAKFASLRFEGRLEVEWRLCHACFPIAAREFSEIEKRFLEAVADK